MAPTLVHPLNIQPIPLTPTHDLNDVRTRRRSSTFSSITNWALAVQPGTPAPLSPPAKRRRPSLHRRVASNSSSPSFLLTPTTAKSPAATNVDLTAWGYTSVFLRLPVTPQTPAAFRPPTRVTEESEKPEKGLKKIKSMGILRRNRDNKSTIGDSTGPTTSPTTRSRSGSISTAKQQRSGHVKSKSVISATALNKSKSKSTKKARHHHPPLPPALQNELMLMQFTGGGSLEKNAQRFMEERSKADSRGASATTAAAVDVAYRDENGVLWLDEEERAEYQSLIPADVPSSPPASPWVQFTSFNGGPAATDADSTRRPSVVSLSPTERELEGATTVIVRPVSPCAYVGFGAGAGLVVPTTTMTSPSPASADRTERRKRRRPAPLKLHSTGSVPTTTTTSHQQEAGFEDSFEPTSAEAATLAAGMYSYYATRRAVVGPSRGADSGLLHRYDDEVGSAPADVVAFNFEGGGGGKGKKKNLAKRAKALFGIE